MQVIWLNQNRVREFDQLFIDIPMMEFSDECAQQYMNCINSCGSSDMDCNIACSREYNECESC